MSTNNRRKYDGRDINSLLANHEESDEERFSGMEKRLGRMEIAIYGLYAAIGLFTFLIDHPTVITNLTTPAHAEEMHGHPPKEFAR